MRLSSLFSLFKMPPKVPVHGAKQRKQLLRAAVMQSSSGNILLQSGHFVTEEEIEEAKRLLLVPSEV